MKEILSKNKKSVVQTGKGEFKMKKLLALFTFVAAFICLFAFQSYAGIESESVPISLNKTNSYTFQSGDCDAYYKFTPSVTDYYELNVDNFGDKSTFINLYNQYGDNLGIKGVDDFSGECYYAEKLEAGQTYYFEISCYVYSYDFPVTAGITLARHTHDLKKDYVYEASFYGDGYYTMECRRCCFEKEVKIYKATAALAKSTYTYTGNVITPSVVVKDRMGKTLVRNTDYTVSYSAGRVNPRRYSVKITLKGNYDDSKVLYFNIVPGVTGKIVAKQTTNAIKLTWYKVPGATGYRVFLYNTKTKKYVTAATTTNNTVTLTKLKPGTDYIYAVRAYTIVNNTVFWSAGFKTIATATKPATPTLKVTAGTKKATLSWNKQVGADGYVIYMSTSKNGKYTKIATVKGNVNSFTKTGLTKGKYYYFRVAAYSVAGGNTIYGGFSSIKSAKIK